MNFFLVPEVDLVAVVDHLVQVHLQVDHQVHVLFHHILLGHLEVQKDPIIEEDFVVHLRNEAAVEKLLRHRRDRPGYT